MEIKIYLTDQKESLLVHLILLKYCAEEIF